MPQDQQVLKVLRITGLERSSGSIVNTVEAATGVPLEPADGGWPSPQTDAG